MGFIFKKPLVFRQQTGVTIDPNNTELLGQTQPSTTTDISIGQDVSTDSNVIFSTLNTKKVEIDSGSLIISGSTTGALLSGSFTLGGSLNISQSLTTQRNLILQGRLTAKNINSQLSESFTIFESGSTIFGDTSDDVHQFSGSLVLSGSINLDNNDSIRTLSNDTSLSDSDTLTLPTENAVKTYIDNQTNPHQEYLRKSFTHTGSFVSISTASFTAVTASAPSDLTSTNENDFIFFLNGQMMEHDALTIQQTNTTLLLKVDNQSIGFDMEPRDEIIGFGKFNS